MGGEVPHGYAIRLSLSEVKGINAGEVDRIVAGRPYQSLSDFWHRARVSRPIVERLVLAGGFDTVYGITVTDGAESSVRRRHRITRRDLLLQIAELERFGRAVERAGAAGRSRGLGKGRGPADVRAQEAAARSSTDPDARDQAPSVERHPLATPGVWARASAQSQATRPARPVTSVQLALELGDEPGEGEVSGLPEMTAPEQMQAELEILGLDASRHVVDSYTEFLDELEVVRSPGLLSRRSKAEVLIAGVKVATQTPPIRSGRRVVFLTLDDGTGPVDATFFEDAQGPYASTVFGSWLLVVRGELRRTGYRGVSVRGTGAWDLVDLHRLWQGEGIDAVREAMAARPAGFTPAGHRVLVHPNGFKMSAYADIKPAGADPKQVPRSLWHRSPGTPG